MSANPDFDQVAATTLKLYIPKLQDNLTRNQALVYSIKKEGMYEEKEGGETIVVPLLSSENDTVESFAGDDQFSIDPQDGIDAAETNWAQMVGTVRINGFQQFVNQGRQKVIDLLDSKLQQLELSMKFEENRQMYGDGSGNGGKDMDGLAAAVEDGTAWSTYGGIDSNANVFWRNVFIPDVGDFQLNGHAAMVNGYNSASIGTDHPKLITTTQAIFQAFEIKHENQKVFYNDDMLKAGFDNFMFKRATIVFDDDMDTGEMLLLNTTKIKYIVGKGRNFTMTDWRRMFDRDVRLAQMFVHRNIVVFNRHAQARLTDITT